LTIYKYRQLRHLSVSDTSQPLNKRHQSAFEQATPVSL